MDTDVLPLVSIYNRGGFCSGKVFAVQKKARDLLVQLLAAAYSNSRSSRPDGQVELAVCDLQVVCLMPKLDGQTLHQLMSKFST